MFAESVCRWLAFARECGCLSTPVISAPLPIAEVIFVYEHIDDFTMNALHEYSGKRLVSIESADVDANDVLSADEEAAKNVDEVGAGVWPLCASL